jgi:hypothetical protein
MSASATWHAIPHAAQAAPGCARGRRHPHRRLRFGQHQAPAAGDDLLARGHQRLLAAGEIRHGAVELVVREELRQVMRPDQPVHRQFLLAHGREVRRFERRDDAVVRRDLAVVPGARALGAVELAHDRAQRRDRS